MRVFFDSSAFAKRYLREEGTELVLSWCDQATELCLSGIALPEIISAFCRLHRENLIAPLQYRHLKTMLMADITDAVICDLTPEVIRSTVITLEQNVLRGMDAIHIGSALALKADVFVSADARQCSAAQQAGLRVVRV
ncbi:type II toxin-antitoxin system VapC family toxin [Trichlorobacter ammonificans]|uniref:Twitching motility protein PilT n=1 Tax=Trichlorobacter ammonificans TaxID=2916410 RepID=A0ABN8HL64_9BACT|nr:type II toxin-antitoxin system VapC family toxin [Trichlorobacter ammonificans]CAH2031672.1 Twitching motility protein PilT [Trichlorobacter ammonificans]